MIFILAVKETSGGPMAVLDGDTQDLKRGQVYRVPISDGRSWAWLRVRHTGAFPVASIHDVHGGVSIATLVGEQLEMVK